MRYTTLERIKKIERNERRATHLLLEISDFGSVAFSLEQFGGHRVEAGGGLGKVLARRGVLLSKRLDLGIAV